jgi:hypothetical protein
MAGKAAHGAARIRIVSFTETTVEVVFLDASDMYDTDGPLVLPRGNLNGRTITATRVGGKKRTGTGSSGGGGGGGRGRGRGR